MLVFKINGLWVLSRLDGSFVCSLIGQRQPKDRREAEVLLLAKAKTLI